MLRLSVPWLLPSAVVLPLLRDVAAARRVPSAARAPAAARQPRRRAPARAAERAAVAGLAHGATRLAAARSPGSRSRVRGGAMERGVVRSSGVDLVLVARRVALDDGDGRAAEPARAHEAGDPSAPRAESRAIASGVLAFAGRSYVLSPMTVDGGALDLFLDNLDPQRRRPGRELARADDRPGHEPARADEEWRGSRAGRHERRRGVRAARTSHRRGDDGRRSKG